MKASQEFQELLMDKILNCILILTGEVCCPNEEENRVSVGIGDSCCQGMPYSTSGNQICCGGSLHDSFNQQCCGGRVISMDSVCCGDEKEGTAYRPLTGK